ncbi:type IX secretion/gliding motility protein PorT/SprT [Pontibacter rugosus]|uniref:Porin family protein n=1 Tax=Pontibacter rugosus TaxID=1745966 RepID=A0ABW3SW87_9BACT
MALLLLLGNTTQAQQKIKTLNKPGYDDRPVHYGFYLAMPLTKYNLQHSQAYVDQLQSADANGTPRVSINTKTDIGFYTGLVLNVRLAEYLDARFVPGVGFYSRTIQYNNAPTETGERLEQDEQTLNNVMVELPLLLKYKSKRRSNYRPYLVAGIKPGIDLGKGNNGGEGINELQIEDFDLALEYGLGLDIFYPFFKFAPELRFSHGLINQHKQVQESNYSAYIQKLTNHNVSLILFFE